MEKGDIFLFAISPLVPEIFRSVLYYANLVTDDVTRFASIVVETQNQEHLCKLWGNAIETWQVCCTLRNTPDGTYCDVAMVICSISSCRFFTSNIGICDSIRRSTWSCLYRKVNKETQCNLSVSLRGRP